jgi:hypothetical protein
MLPKMAQLADLRWNLMDPRWMEGGYLAWKKAMRQAI